MRKNCFRLRLGWVPVFVGTRGALNGLKPAGCRGASRAFSGIPIFAEATERVCR
jgi:hypothetical protein